MKTSNHSPLPDQTARDQFRTGLDRNFSVIAPAGVGKTTAIVERIAAMADRGEQDGENMLSSLIVVTYTIKAAAEMKERARQRLAESGPGATERLAAFNAAFFGTIHGFCLELLRRWGHVLGLPPSLQLVDDEDALWLEFLSAQDHFLESMPESVRRTLPRFVDMRDFAGLVRRLPAHGQSPLPSSGPVPVPGVAAVLAFETTNKRSIPVVERNQRRLRQWLEAYESGKPWVGLPEFKGGGKEFEALCEEAFAPLRVWLAQATGAAAAELARRYRAFRLERGEVLFEDQVSLARELTGHPEAGRRIREQGWRVILDEAQDTDPAQFDVLLSVAQSPEARGSWRQGDLPPPGRFCMVGDPQQSIYPERADIATYLSAHESLIHAPGGSEVKFTVTMRCDGAIVDWVNVSVRATLNGDQGQIDLVPLQVRPNAGPGAVEVLKLEPEAALDSRKEGLAVQEEARLIAEWLKKSTPGDFGVADWSEIALLCPRKNSRLEVLAQALQAVDLPCQNHGQSEVRGENPVFAWMSGLAAVLADPENAFELAGVLREVFGLSDGAMASFVHAQGFRGQGHPLNILRQSQGAGPVAEALATLRRMRLTVLELPMRSGFSRLIAWLSLEERLRSLPEVSTEALEELAAMVATAEEAGEGWPELARMLRQACRGVGGEADPEPGKIQLLTCQKAKGLEWPVVIVPYLFATIHWPRPTYPLALNDSEGAWIIALDAAHDTGAAKAKQLLRTAQSLERLLYVTLTRPRRRLVLVDDEAFFPKGKESFAECLRLREGEENREPWQALPPWIACAGEGSHEPETRGAVWPMIAEIMAPVTVAVPSFLRRILPSSLARHDEGRTHERAERDRLAEPEYPELAKSALGGTGYGNWWHGAMETMPWEATREQWVTHLEDALRHCPIPERGQREIDLFLRSDLAAWLASSQRVRTEIPMLWRADEEEAYDGSIDLVARMPGDAWLLVDWKTDRVDSDPEAELLAAYGPQLAAYQRALLEAHGNNLKAVLYSTRTGAVAELKRA